MKKVYLFLLLFIIGLSKVNAACSTEEKNLIKKEMDNINIVYTFMENFPDNYDMNYDQNVYRGVYYKFYIYNLTGSYSVSVENNFDNKTLYFTKYDAADGKITFEENGSSEKSITYTFTIKNLTSGCENLVERKVTLITPKYNVYYRNPVCETHKGAYVCQRYYPYNLDDEKFEIEIKKYGIISVPPTTNNNDNNSTITEELTKLAQFYNKYKVYIASGILVIILATGLSIAYKKKHRRKNIGYEF